MRKSEYIQRQSFGVHALKWNIQEAVTKTPKSSMEILRA